MRMRMALKGAIYEAGRSQREVARLADLSESRMSAITRGWVAPTEEERAALSRVLGTAAEELFPEEPVQGELPYATPGPEGISRRLSELDRRLR